MLKYNFEIEKNMKEFISGISTLSSLHLSQIVIDQILCPRVRFGSLEESGTNRFEVVRFRCTKCAFVYSEFFALLTLPLFQNLFAITRIAILD